MCEGENDFCSGRTSWLKGELIMIQITVVRMYEDRIDEVLDN